MSNIYPRCTMCGQIPAKGLYDGFRLKRKFICSVCEKRIVTAELGGSEYSDNMRFIRSLLYPRTISPDYSACVKK